MHHDPLLRKFRSRRDARDVAVPKLKKRGEKLSDIPRIGAVEKINVPGEPRIAVEDHSLATDNHAFHLVTLQHAEKLNQVGGKIPRGYFVSRRHDSLTSGGLGPKTLLCRARAASMRSEGVISRY